MLWHTYLHINMIADECYQLSFLVCIHMYTIREKFHIACQCLMIILIKKKTIYFHQHELLWAYKTYKSLSQLIWQRNLIYNHNVTKLTYSLCIQTSLLFLSLFTFLIPLIFFVCLKKKEVNHSQSCQKNKTMPYLNQYLPVVLNLNLTQKNGYLSLSVCHHCRRCRRRHNCWINNIEMYRHNNRSTTNFGLFIYSFIFKSIIVCISKLDSMSRYNTRKKKRKNANQARTR